MHSKAVDFIPRVQYEYHMLRYTYDYLCSLDRSRSEPYHEDVLSSPLCSGAAEEDISAFLESFLLHARILRDFLCNDRRYADDVLAVDFFDSKEEWINQRPENREYLSQHRDRLNKAVAHLTYSRIDYETSGKGWEINSILEEITQLWNAFLAAIPDDVRARFEDVDQAANNYD